MNSNTTTQGAAAGSYGLAAAITVIIVGALQHNGWQISAEMSAAIPLVIGAALHYGAMLLGLKDETMNMPVTASPESIVVAPVETPHVTSEPAAVRMPTTIKETKHAP